MVQFNSVCPRCHKELSLILAENAKPSFCQYCGTALASEDSEEAPRNNKLYTGLVVCRVAYMKYYDGITADDMPVNGGSYVSDTQDAFEKNNFHKYPDGYCYGFVETKYKKGHMAENAYAKSISLEQINPVYKSKTSIDGVRIVFVALCPTLHKTVVVGWYDNATIYRRRVVEPNKVYNMKCLYKDAHLIPDKERHFEIPRAQVNPYGIGQSNFWYIHNHENARDFEKEMMRYIDSMMC